MPPPGENQLTQAQIDLIAQWINQGALNLVCDDGLGPCDSTTVSYLADVQPIMQNKCVGCHTTANSGNAFVALTNYAEVSATVPTGQLVGSIIHDPDYTAMPQNGPMLSNCEIAKIRNWVSEGALNN
jgi:mono/diheme cytochrome c family protein